MDHPLTRTLELVRKAQDGDGDAMNRLFERYYERVRRLVRARIGPELRARLDTEDILQPAFAKAFAKFDCFEMRTEGGLLRWLAEIAEGQVRDALDHERAKKRRPPAGLRSLEDAGPESGALGHALPTSATGPVERAAGAEQRAAIDECIAELPEHYRGVIELRYYEALEWREVAARLKKNTESAARELHQRALLELTRLLARRGIGPESR